MVKMFKDKRGVFDNLSNMALGVLYFVIIVAVGALVLTEVRNTGSVSGNTNATAAVNTGINAVQSLAGWAPVVIVVGVGAVLLALLFTFRGRAQ